MCRCAERITLEDLDEQLFGPGLILLNRVAPSHLYCGDQEFSETDLRVDGARIDLQRSLEKSSSLFSNRYGSRPADQRPRANDEIAGIRVDRLFLFDAAARLLQEFKVEGPP
jgi:hypothetical protein